MPGRFDDDIQRLFELKEYEGENKIATLDEAIRRNIEPGMTLHIQWQATAILLEILRQFRGTKPGFTLVTNIFSGCLTNLVHTDLVGKLVISLCSHLYPAPGPIKVVQKAHRAGTLEIEHWSVCSLQQRLMAGAQGLLFLPTKSIMDSTMAEDNRETYAILNDPFGGVDKIGVVKALNPDVSLIHCLAADRYGNAILSQPLDESFWGPRASKSVIITVENLVTTDYIRRHSHLVKLPGYMVDSVVIAPLGIHPSGLSNLGLEGVDGYAEDFQFMRDYRKAAESADSLDGWIKEWVIDCPDHEAYLSKLGSDRILRLKDRANVNTCRHDMEPLVDGIVDSDEYNSTEMMIIAAAREIRDSVLDRGHKILQVAMGPASLAAILAYYRLRDDDGYGIDMVSGIGEIGHLPCPPDHYLMGMSYVSTAKMLTDVIEAYSVVIGGANNRCLSALGAAQIDSRGNINSTMLPGGRFAVGAGGANDAANMSSEIIAVGKQSRDRFLKELSYISSPGDRVRTLVSSMGIFRKGDSGEFELVACYPDTGMTMKERIEAVKENCGWEFKVADEVMEVMPPSRDELRMLRLLDPKKLFIRE